VTPARGSTASEHAGPVTTHVYLFKIETEMLSPQFKQMFTVT